MMEGSHFKDNFDLTTSTMQARISNLHCHIDSIIHYLTPLLPLANCHMVEFFTLSHWEKLLPSSLRKQLDDMNMTIAVDKFWAGAEDNKNDDDCEINKWMRNAHSNCVQINDDYCISTERLQAHIEALGGEKKPEMWVKEFMSSKKSYEVAIMSRVVSAVESTASVRGSVCVEAGGGRGHLPLALSLGYALPTLTLDCDHNKIEAARERAVLMQKQWHSITKKTKDRNEVKMQKEIANNLHRFATCYITKETDLCSIVKQQFPEYSNKCKLLLTGLHTCGNLGPDSLRLFASDPSIAALVNVPCCYHHLSEAVDCEMFDVFQRDYGGSCDAGQGFPMSHYLRGYNLGRNARMLAAQSIDRVLDQRQLPAESLLYRALLQVIIKKYKPDFPLIEGKLKRLKCKNFQEYFKMADNILNLELYDGLSDSCSNEEYDCQWKKIVLFYLTRLCLAQVVESVILLDRILFLMENGFSNVYLVKLFDPIRSPRCHSIVGIR